jgi:hypothetical protein
MRRKSQGQEFKELQEFREFQEGGGFAALQASAPEDFRIRLARGFWLLTSASLLSNQVA